ncbi:MAG: hypothetical protein MJ194_02640 [Clostridia bacterium]|nr:hypothetical protein [Clostridia bacterium]
MNSNTANLIGTVLTVVVALFILGPAIATCISQFTVQRKFNAIMIEKGVVPEEEVKKLHPKKEAAGVIICLVLLGVVAAICIKNDLFTLIFTLLALAFGIFKNRKVMQFNSFTAQRFKAAYGNVMDAKKFNKYIDEIF